jgi:hypothetical protein
MHRLNVILAIVRQSLLDMLIHRELQHNMADPQQSRGEPLIQSGEALVRRNFPQATPNAFVPPLCPRR